MARRKRRNKRRVLKNSRLHRRLRRYGKRKHAHNGRRRYGRNRRSRRSHRIHGRRRGFNPGSIVSSLTSGFKLDTLKTAGLLVAGGVANKMLSDRVAGLIPVQMLQSGPGAYLPRLLTAGLIGGIAGMAIPRFASTLLTGAVMQVGLKAVSEYLPSYGLTGMGDYLNLSQVQNARPLAGLGDYLTSQQVSQARPLLTGMGYGGDDWLSSTADSFDSGAF